MIRDQLEMIHNRLEWMEARLVQIEEDLDGIKSLLKSHPIEAFPISTRLEFSLRGRDPSGAESRLKASTLGLPIGDPQRPSAQPSA